MKQKELENHSSWVLLILKFYMSMLYWLKALFNFRKRSSLILDIVGIDFVPFLPDFYDLFVVTILRFFKVPMASTS